MALLKWVFAVFILSLPLAELGRFQFPNGIAFSFNDIILGLSILLWLIYKLHKDRKITKSRLLKPGIIFSVVAFISLLLNIFNLTPDRFFISFLYLLRWVSYFLLFFIVKDFDSKFRKKVPYLLILSGIVVVVVGYIQYFLYPSLRNLYYLGWDEHLYRMFSSFLDPNFLGSFLVLLLVLVLGLLYKSYKEKKVLFVSSFSILAVPILAAVYLTYSRSALLMLIVSISTFLFLIGKKKIILICVLFLILIIFLLPKSFKTEGTNFLRTASSDARISSSETAIKIFQGSPLYGVGFDAYRYAQNRYGLNNQYWEVTHSGAGTDNSYLFVLATTGIIGLICYIYLIFNLLIMAKVNLTKNIFSLVLISSMAGLLVDSIFINSLFYVFILEWVWIIAGLIESK